MEKISIGKLIEYTNGNLLKGNKDEFITNIVIDSREVNEKSLFVPIIGARFDGHDFMESCYDNGCRNFICDKNHTFLKEDINLIVVDDTTKAFGDIASGYKENLDIPTIAITGSVGKTSTKDMIYAVLSEKFNTLKTIGNLNNEIGVPKTLLRLDSSIDNAVVEMGMDRKGQISYLTKLVKPNIGVITNIGMSHIEHFDNQDGIFSAKMEITDSFSSDNILIVNGDDKYLKTLKENELNYKLITCGFEKDNDIYCEKYNIDGINANFTCVYNDKKYDFVIPSPAKHNILNAMFAIAIANIYDFTEEEIRKGLLNFELSSNRLDIFKTDKYRIINDTYNASFDSMMSALDVLNNFEGRKVAILGDIFELGSYSEEIHRKIGKVLNCDLLITIGQEAKYIYEEAKDRIESLYFLTKEDFYDKISAILLEGDTILVKASRGMELEKVVNFLKE